jgi:ATP-binding cassette subfamily A (ABC1) protein 3
MISYFKKNQETSFLLGSHSMEECENLCDKVAIMKNGQIEDQGNLLTLKSRYRNDYKLIIKLNNSTGDTASIKNCLSLELGAVIQEEYAEYLEFHVKNPGKRLSGIFDLLENLKSDHTNIEDYIISEISLEDIYLSVAKEKDHEKDVQV